uniref:glutamate receptor 1.3-like n=1 Tax=Erigeron canadensis TaxID=72917 RepID=UPI001CB96ABA|nr:glutamate receptor 1.3-like [Erigeron canadensis]
MGSWVGKVVHRCITMAIADFYAANPHYTTRIVINTKDTKGEPLLALSAALELLENTKVQAIIGPDATVESRFLDLLEQKANIPFLSFATSTLSNKNPYFLQIAQDEATEFKGIATMVQSFKWKNVVLICENTANGRQMATYMFSAFQEKNIPVAYTSLISTSYSNEQIREELHSLQNMQTTMFVIHTSPSLSSKLFFMAKEVGMMGEGYVWIVTSKTTNHINFMDAETIKSMQGAVGFKSYFPKSDELRKFNSKWRKEYHDLNPIMEMKEIDSNGIWAYDAVYALAMAVEKVQTTVMGTSLLDQISKTNFHGLGGDFKLMNGKPISKAIEIINVIGKGDRRVGFWMVDGEFVKEIGKTNLFSNRGLESIIWPGGTATIPTHRMLQMNGKKLRFLVPVFGAFPSLIQMAVDPTTNRPTVSGFCGDVFNVAYNALTYGVEIEFVPYLYEHGRTYGDLIDKVYLEGYDGAIGDITITSNRSHYVDFTFPFSDMGVGTIAQNGKKSMWIFLSPLSADLWFTSAGFFLFLGFVIWFIEHRTNEEFQGSTKQQIGTTLWFAFSTLVYAHREKLQSNLSRFVVIIWLFVVLVLTSSYTATLSSLLTVQQIASKGGEVQFQSISHVGVPVFNNVQLTKGVMTPLFSPGDYVQALRSRKVSAISDEILYIKSVLALYSAAEFSLVSTASTTNGFGIVFQKGSPLTTKMSSQIAKLRGDGTLKALEDKWLKQQSSMILSKDLSTPPPTILNLNGFGGLFLISGTSMVLALLISIVYILRKTLWKRKLEIMRSLLRRSPEIHPQDNDVEPRV